jgi:DNA topoisomerase-3
MYLIKKLLIFFLTPSNQQTKFSKNKPNKYFHSIYFPNYSRVISIKTEKKHKGRPNALNTVELLKVASAGLGKNADPFYWNIIGFLLGMSPHHAMQIAERLYTSGYVSYPRTETTQYADNADLKGVLRELSKCSGADWQNHVTLLNEGQYTPPKRGKDVGDHPPITPVKAASSAAVGGGDYWRLYDYIARHFLATV